MEQPDRNTAMDRAGRDKSRIRPGYLLAAAAIWTLVLYSVSSLYRPDPPEDFQTLSAALFDA